MHLDFIVSKLFSNRDVILLFTGDLIDCIQCDISKSVTLLNTDVSLQRLNDVALWREYDQRGELQI